MAESLIEKAQRLGMKPAGAPVAQSVLPTTTPTPQETLLQKAQRLGVKPANQSFFTKTGPSYKASEGGANTILPNVAKTFGNIPSSARDLTRSIISPVNPFDTENPMNIGANIAKAPGIIIDIFKTAGFTGGLKSIAGGVADTLKKGSEAVGGAIYNPLEKNVIEKDSVIGGLKQTGTDIIEGVAKIGIENPLLIPSMIYGGPKAVGAKTTDAISDVARVVTQGVDTSLPKIKTLVTDTVKTLTQKSEASIEKAILKKFEKGVKPLIPAKTTPNQLSNYREDVISAVKTIKENQPNLKFTDEAGGLIEGQTPRSLQELADSIEQTKKSVFTKYDTLAKEAGEAGVKVDTVSIASELDSVINNKALAITNPKAIKYAEELKQRLIDTGNLDAMTSQEVIQNYNKSLEAFYRNPSYDNASQAAIDAMVANNMRKSLDEGITGLTGTQYSALKKQYGALKAIEKDVIKATLRDARKNTKGLIDFTDIFSGGQLASGILTLNPQAIIQGGTQKAIAEFYKYLNNPNRAIEKMFKAVDTLPQKNQTPYNTLLRTAAPTQSTNNIVPNTAIPKILPEKPTQVNKVEAEIKKAPGEILPTKKEIPLEEQAKKYKSAEEFVMANIEKNTFNKQNQFLTEIPVSNVAHESLKSGVKSGRKVELPIEAEFNTWDNTWRVSDGQHRIEQAIANGDKNIPAKVSYVERIFNKNDAGTYTSIKSEKDLTKSQLTDIWNKANKTKPVLPAKKETTLYHGTNDDFTKFNPGANKEDYGTWFANNRTEIDQMGMKNVKEQTLKPGVKLATESQWDKTISMKKYEDMSYKEMIDATGVRGVKYPNGDVQLFFPNEDTIPVKSILPKKDLSQQRITDVTKFESDSSLSPKLKTLEKNAFDYVVKNEDKILADYKAKYGTYINSDQFRPFLKEAGYTDGSLAAGVQEPVSYLAKRARAEALKGPGDYVVGTAGGSGVGKTSAAKVIPSVSELQKNAVMVLDSNFSSMKSARKFLDEVKTAGKEFVGIFTYRDFMDSMINGVVKRMLFNKEEMGRLVPTKITAGNHVGSFDVIKQLADEGINFLFVDNSLGQNNAKLVNLADLEKKIKYTTPAEMTKEANGVIKNMYENKIPITDNKGNSKFINKAQYEGLIE